MAPGDGAPYTDAHDPTTVWEGRNAARCATAYYVGAVLEWLRRKPGGPGDGPVLRELHGVQFELYRNAMFREQMDAGRLRVAALKGA